MHDKLAQLSAKIAVKYIPSYLEKKLKPKPQDEKEATYAPKLTRESGKIDWAKPAEEIERLIRAYYPWPGAHTAWNGKTLKIIKVNLGFKTQINLKEKNHQIGKSFLCDNQLAVQCGDNALIINELQLAGGKKMTGKEFLAGHRDIINSILQ